MKNFDREQISSIRKKWTNISLRHFYISTSISLIAFFTFIGAQHLNASLNIGPKIDSGLDGSGNVFKIWQGYDTPEQTYRIIYVSKGNMGEAWSEQQNLSLPNQNGYEPIIGVLTAGNAIALWLGIDTTIPSNVLYASFYSSGTWSAPARVSENTESVKFGSYRCIIDDDENILVTWESVNLQPVDDVYNSMIRSANAILGGSWNSPITISII